MGGATYPGDTGGQQLSQYISGLVDAASAEKGLGQNLGGLASGGLMTELFNARQARRGRPRMRTPAWIEAEAFAKLNSTTLDGVYLDRSEVIKPIKPTRIGWRLRFRLWLVAFTGGEPTESAAKRICDALQEKRDNDTIATPYYVDLDGHCFCWTGWKVGDSPNPLMFPELKTLAGQWSVVSPADKNARLYSSYPGGEGVLVNWLSKSQPQVELTPKEHQVWPDTSWTAKQLKPLEEECLSRLRVLVAKLEPVSSSL